MNPLFYFLLLLESCSFAPLIFSMYGGFAVVTLSKARALKEETVASRTVLCLQRSKSFQALASPCLAAAQPAAKKSSHRKWESAAWAGKIVLSCFQGLASPYLAAAGHQKSSRRK